MFKHTTLRGMELICLCCLYFLTQISQCFSSETLNLITSAIPQEFQVVKILSEVISDNEYYEFFNTNIPVILLKSLDGFEVDYHERKSLVILSQISNERQNVIWSSLSQDQMRYNIWIVIQNERLKFSNNTLRFGLDTLLFQIDENTNKVHQYLGNGEIEPMRRDIGLIPNIDWDTIIENTRQRNTFNGAILKANFGDFPPFCQCKDLSNIKGIVHEKRLLFNQKNC